MPSEQLTAEIESAIDDMVLPSNDTPAGEPDNKGAIDAASDDAKVMAEVAANDAAGDKLAADNEKASQELADEAGKVAKEAADDAKAASADAHTGQAKGEVAPSEPIKAPPAPVEPQSAKPLFHSDDLLARAVDTGISVVDAKQLSPYALEVIVSRREEAALEADDPRDIGLQKDPVADPFADLPKLDPEVHDPSVIAMFDKMTEVVKGQHSELQDLRAEQAEQNVTAVAREEVELKAATSEIKQFFDGQVKGLGDNFLESLGTGDFDSLDRGSPQFANRDAIAGQMSVLMSGYQAQGQTPPSREEIFDTAARIVLRDTFQGIREKEIAGTLKTQSGQHLQRSGSVQASTTKTPDEDAAAAVDALLNSRQ